MRRAGKAAGPAEYPTRESYCAETGRVLAHLSHGERSSVFSPAKGRAPRVDAWGPVFLIGDQVLYVVTIRSEGEKYAHNHISHEASTRAFCGTPIPDAVVQCGLSDPRNPYVGRGSVTCTECVSELHNGRRDGYRDVIGD